MLKRAGLCAVKIYQGYVRSLLPSSCRFTPSCSEYAKEAIIRYGFVKGGFKALKRLLTCHPFSGKAGYDPLI